MVRSRSMLAVAITLLGGCDLAFDINLDADPCELGSFGETTAVELATNGAEDFSADWAMTFGVVMFAGSAYEIDLTTNAMTPIDLGPYTSHALSLAPEGNALFYTASAEPSLLKGALRPSAAEWILDAGVPRGTFAGTPSADVFGPRRVVVRERDTSTDVQEFEDVAGRWMPVGEPHPMTSNRAPNLTPNGLTMVWVETVEAAGVVRAAQRPTIAEWFGPPTDLRSGPIQTAQLLGECKRLYVVEDGALRQYDR
jgi:hypothetical protein